MKGAACPGSARVLFQAADRRLLVALRAESGWQPPGHFHCIGFGHAASVLLCCGASASHYGGFSGWGAQAFGFTGSGVAASRLRCSAACGIFPDQGLNLVPCTGWRILIHWTTKEVLVSFNGATNPFHKSATLMTWLSPKVLPPHTVTMGIRFLHMDLGVGNTDMQVITHPNLLFLL